MHQMHCISAPKGFIKTHGHISHMDSTGQILEQEDWVSLQETGCHPTLSGSYLHKV